MNGVEKRDRLSPQILTFKLAGLFLGYPLIALGGGIMLALFGFYSQTDPLRSMIAQIFGSYDATMVWFWLRCAMAIYAIMALILIVAGLRHDASELSVRLGRIIMPLATTTGVASRLQATAYAMTRNRSIPSTHMSQDFSADTRRTLPWNRKSDPFKAMRYIEAFVIIPIECAGMLLMYSIGASAMRLVLSGSLNALEDFLASVAQPLLSASAILCFGVQALRFVSILTVDSLEPADFKCAEKLLRLFTRG